MKFEIFGIEYQDMKEIMDDLVGYDLKTYRLKKVYGIFPGYWLQLTVNKHHWFKTWKYVGNNIKDTTECLEKSFTEELQVWVMKTQK